MKTAEDYARGVRRYDSDSWELNSVHGECIVALFRDAIRAARAEAIEEALEEIADQARGVPVNSDAQSALRGAFNRVHALSDADGAE